MKTPAKQGSDLLSKFPQAPTAGAMPAKTASHLVKKTFKNIPMSMPEDWCVNVDDLADKMGNTRNGILLMMVQIAGPILRMEYELRKKIVREACEQVLKEAGK